MYHKFKISLNHKTKIKPKKQEDITKNNYDDLPSTVHIPLKSFQLTYENVSMFMTNSFSVFKMKILFHHFAFQDIIHKTSPI